MTFGNLERVGILKSWLAGAIEHRPTRGELQAIGAGLING